MPRSYRDPTSATPSAEDEVGPVFNSLRRLVHALHAASRETERKLGVTGAQLFVLDQLRTSPSLSINALAERTMKADASHEGISAMAATMRLIAESPRCG